MKSIAIEREFGSGGRAVGKKVAELAGIPYYDSELLVKTASEFDYSLDALKEYDERRTGSFLYDLATYANINYDTNTQKIQELLYAVGETIQRLALRGPCVFIGRASTEVLRKNGLGKGVYIYSSDNGKKIQRIMETERVSEPEAKRLMDKKDRDRKNFYRTCTEKNWSDRKNYDLEINMANFTVQESARIIMAILK
ncbi:MAG: cytidylate kinase-like family protein [Lachnospiraceae bacterium]|nr:cytidylate kinase-like family protein [Lachnospiraceae bacterium]MDD3796395.1 cytidylate kinase-like family protein [Lachnospiraceae bacterium]